MDGLPQFVQSSQEDRTASRTPHVSILCLGRYSSGRHQNHIFQTCQQPHCCQARRDTDLVSRTSSHNYRSRVS